MEFNSVNFLFFFAAVTTLYYLISQRLRLAFLLIASLTFYGWWQPQYLGILLGVSVVTYLISISLSNTTNNHRQSLLLSVGIGLVLIVLAFFKYSAFIAESVLNMFNQKMNVDTHRFLDALLPIGISFYTFQSISYMVDVYRKRSPAVKEALPFALYLSFFPQILAGPIERASRLIPQLTAPAAFNAFNVISGCKRMIWGYGCKVLVADNLAPLVDRVYGNVFDQNGLTLLIATYLFGFQIYFDFLGYTNIAIGAAKVLSIDLSQNFRRPYLAHSLRNFWHRWHITLSTWFRDYVYIPLGGSKKGRLIHLFAIASVFLLSGLWHGAAWSFVLWGAAHGVFYLAEEYSVRKAFSRWHGASSLRTGIGRVLTFNLVMLLWLFFRAETIVEIGHILKSLPSAFVHPGKSFPEAMTAMNITINQLLAGSFLLCTVFILDASKVIEIFINRPLHEKTRWYELVTWDVLLILLLVLGDIGGRNFVYFRF